MVLNWKYQGPQGWFFLSQDKGYFKQEGLDVTIDQGNGSGAGVPLVANGTYDVAFGDINALIELAGRKPADAPVAVYLMYNQPPFTVAVKAESPIKSPKDFEGRTLGGAANDGALKLFPAFCKLARIDCSKVNITNMQPNLREQMLMQGQVDGVFGYLNTVFTQTVPFAGDEFHAGNGAQGVAGAVVRTGGLVALVLRAFTRQTTAALVRYQTVQGQLAARLSESLAGARTVAAAGTIDRERHRVLAPLSELRTHDDVRSVNGEIDITLPHRTGAWAIQWGAREVTGGASLAPAGIRVSSPEGSALVPASVLHTTSRVPQ